MKIVFFGTPEFAVPSLRELLRGPDPVVGVVSQPDRPAGRGQRLVAPPTKRLALEAGVPVLQPEKARDQAFLAALRGWAPDLIVVVAYGKILPAAILDLPANGCINVHASLLPKYRGAAPIQWAIYHGETHTGVTIMRINERMDAGDILLQREIEIGSDETYGALQARLADLGALALRQALDLLRSGRLEAKAQDESLATYAPSIQKQQGQLDWSAGARQLAQMVRAFHPWPSAFTFVAGKRLQIHRAETSAENADAHPGTVVGVGDRLLIATAAGTLAACEVQLEGRKRLSAAEFCRSGAVQLGTQLG